MKPASFTKTTWEEIVLSFDTTPHLGPTDPLASVSAIVVGDEQGVDHSSTMVDGVPAMVGNVIYVMYKGGTANTRYKVRVRGITTAGEKVEDDFTLVVKE